VAPLEASATADAFYFCFFKGTFGRLLFFPLFSLIKYEFFCKKLLNIILISYIILLYGLFSPSFQYNIITEIKMANIKPLYQGEIYEKAQRYKA